MKVSWEKSNFLVIDVEGNLNNGIREAALILVNEGKVICGTEFSKEFGAKESIDSQIIGYFSKDENQIPCVLVSHNCSIEHNMLSQLMPYRPSTNNKVEEILWEPWIDSMIVYKKLYPDEQNYNLKSLVDRFINPNEIEKLAKEYCQINKKKYHHAMYDAIACYLLIKRIADRINISKFLLRSGR